MHCSLFQPASELRTIYDCYSRKKSPELFRAFFYTGKCDNTQRGALLKKFQVDPQVQLPLLECIIFVKVRMVPSGAS